MSFIICKNVEHSFEKTPGELMGRFKTSVITSHVFDQVHVFLFFAQCIVFKARLQSKF